MRKKIEKKSFLTTHEAAKLLDVSPTTIMQWCKADQIRYAKTVGGHRRIPAEDIKKLQEDLGFDIAGN